MTDKSDRKEAVGRFVECWNTILIDLRPQRESSWPNHRLSLGVYR
jgi:hypothetical protein